MRTLLIPTSVLLLTAASAQELFLQTDAPQVYAQIPTQVREMLIAQQKRLEDIQFKCQYMAGLNFYDLQPLSIVQSFYEFPATDGSGKTFALSFCQDLPDDKWCDPQQPTMAVMHTPDGKCVTLSGSDPTKNADFEVADADSNDGLDVLYNGGDEGYSFTVNIQCDSSQDFKLITVNGTDNS